MMLFISSAMASTAPDHKYTVDYLKSGAVYEKHKGTFEAKDVFGTENLTFRNTMNFSYAETGGKAQVDNLSRIGDLFVVSGESFRVNVMLSAAFYSGSSFMDNFRYGISYERIKKLGESSSLDYGLMATNAIIYNRVYPGPVIMPILSWSTRFSPSSICRIGLPTLIMYNGLKWSAGFTYLPVFNSKLFFRWMPSAFYGIEVFAYSRMESLVLDDPKKNTNALHMFYSGVYLENSMTLGKNLSLTFGGGCNIFERIWSGHQVAINRGGNQGVSFMGRIGVSAMF